MMPSRRFFVVSVFLMPGILISAFPHLTTRGDCDSLVCGPSLPEVIDGVGNAWNGMGDLLGAGAAVAGGAIGTLAGWTINQATGLLEPPATGPVTPDLDMDPSAFNPTPAPIPDNEIDAVVPPLKNGQCVSTSAPVLDPNQGIAKLGVTNFQDCEKATAQIVWPFNCENTDENANTERILSGMDAGVLKSIDPTCAVEGGTSFWVLNLTPEQVEELKTQQKQIVKDVGANAPIKPCGHPISPDPKVSPAEKKVRYHKRDTVIRVQGFQFENRLPFISSKKRKNANVYAYFSPAGAGVTVYLIDTGLDILNDEFEKANINRDWIFALGADETYSDSGSGYGSAHGTCMASLIAGDFWGVSKKVELVIVKIDGEIASFTDGLGKIVDDVRKKADKGIKVEGYTVVSISWGYPAGPSEQEQMEKYFKELTEKYQVVVVVASGNSDEETYPDVSEWPALFSLTSDIITVGAVRANAQRDNGKRYEWSCGGNALTLSAPGESRCGLLDPYTGTSVSTATVAALAGYFLSLPSVGGYLRGFPNIPKAMINYLDFLSYPRFENEMAVSNGLDGDSERTEYDHWLGVWSDNQPKA